MSPHTIAIIGGTGPQGKGLGYRFAQAGHSVVLGSRSQERAVAAADELAGRLPEDASIVGADNAKAAGLCEVAVIAVPFDGHRDIVASLREPLAGKIVVSCVNPLGFDKSGAFGLQVPEGSAAEQAAALLPESVLVGAFHHLSAVSLLADGEPLGDEDVLVCGDDAAAKQVVIDLAVAVVGKPGVNAGRLRLAAQLETLTAVLISINRRYKVHSGIAVTGLPAAG